MLIRASIENFMSFGERATFSMIPGKVRMHSDHKIDFKNRNEIDLLKLSVIYGANASGKSNLVKAFDFLQSFVIEGSKPNEEINLISNKLNKKFEKKTSRFEIEFRQNGKNYAFGFIADKKRIYEEWLFEINKINEKSIYNRTIDSKGKSSFTFGKIDFSSTKEKEFISFIGDGTRENQLFITECSQRNIKNNVDDAKAFLDTMDWFSNTLVVIFPESKYGGLLFELKENEDFSKTLTEFLKVFDTGVDGIELREYDFDKIADLPLRVKDEVKKSLKSRSKVVIGDPAGNTYLVTKSKTDEILSYRVMTKHKVINSEKCEYFELKEESDGTLRLIDLIPIMTLKDKSRVYIIDELDRSLHPNLSKKFLELFIEKTKKVPSQLIVTSHESSLLDLKNLRKDEIWFVEKDEIKESKMFSLDEFDIRFDKRIRPDYLLGRFGAIPSIKKL